MAVIGYLNLREKYSAKKLNQVQLSFCNAQRDFSSLLDKHTAHAHHTGPRHGNLVKVHILKLSLNDLLWDLDRISGKTKKRLSQ